MHMCMHMCTTNDQAGDNEVRVHRGFLTNLNSVPHAVVEQLTKWTTDAGDKDNVEVRYTKYTSMQSITVNR
jgi:hypothetical protein